MYLIAAPPYRPSWVHLVSPLHMLSQPQNPVSYMLSHVRGEAGAGLCEFCTRKSWSGWTRETAFLTVLLLLISSSWKSSLLPLPVQVQVRLCAFLSSPSYNTVSNLSAHRCASKLLDAALLPWAFKELSLCPGKQTNKQSCSYQK